MSRENFLGRIQIDREEFCNPMMNINPNNFNTTSGSSAGASQKTGNPDLSMSNSVDGR